MHHMDSGHEPRKAETLTSNHESWIKRNFNYQCYITYLTGIYSNHWKFQQWGKFEHGSCCCSRTEQFFYVCLVIACILSVILLFVWIETSNEYYSLDWVAFLGTGRWIYWSIILLCVLWILVTYISLLLIVSFLLLWERIELFMHRTHKILVVLTIPICLLLMALLCKFWWERWLVVGLSLKIFAPFVHLSLIVVMVIISWPISIYMSQLESEGTFLSGAVAIHCRVVNTTSVSVWGMILLLHLPIMALRISPPPLLQCWRLAPENTMMAFEKAIEYDVYGLETDVHVSYEIVPFLMHDWDLRRTTNIREVLPEAAYNHTSSFKWSFLSTLNAGKWFVQTKPFFNMDPLSEADKKRASNQSIPKLADLLALAKKEKKFVIFDLFGPPKKNPYRNTFVRKVVRVILDSKIEQHLILWLPGFDRDYVRHAAPGFQHVGRFIPVKRLEKENISMINVDYKTLFYNGLRDYKAANIFINIYIVNEPWLFSLAWCSRINSVTTDNIQQLSRIKHPHFFMTPKFYMFMWLFMDAISAVSISFIFCFQWWRELKRKPWLEAPSAPPDTHSIRLSKDKHKEKESTRLSITPPSRIEQRPWALPTLHSSSTKSRMKHSETSSFAEAPKKKPMYIKNTVKPLMPTQVFDHTQASPSTAIREATSQTPLSLLKAAESTMPAVEDPLVERYQETPMLSSSNETYTTLFSTSSTSSYEMSPRKH